MKPTITVFISCIKALTALKLNQITALLIICLCVIQRKTKEEQEFITETLKDYRLHHIIKDNDGLEEEIHNAITYFSDTQQVAIRATLGATRCIEPQFKFNRTYKANVIEEGDSVLSYIPKGEEERHYLWDECSGSPYQEALAKTRLKKEYSEEQSEMIIVIYSTQMSRYNKQCQKISREYSTFKIPADAVLIGKGAGYEGQTIGTLVQKTDTWYDIYFREATAPEISVAVSQ